MYTGFICLIDYTVIQCILCIVGAKRADIPWTLGILFRLGAFVRLTQVDEVVESVSHRFANDDWSFSWCRELMHPFQLLDESKNQVALLEGSTSNPAAAVAAQALLIDCHPRECKFARFLQEVDAE